MKSVSVVLRSAAVIALAAPAMAASSDYLLVIDGVGGGDAVTTKVSNWSFGATNTSTPPSASGRAAEPNLGSKGQDGVAPRDAQSGMASGRRRTGAIVAADFKATGDLDGDGRLDLAEAGKLDNVGPLNFTMPSGSAEEKQLCGETDHLRTGHITAPDGTVYDLADVKTVCTGDDSTSVTVALSGSMRRKDYVGHVTLMK